MRALGFFVEFSASRQFVSAINGHSRMKFSFHFIKEGSIFKMLLKWFKMVIVKNLNRFLKWKNHDITNSTGSS